MNSYETVTAWAYTSVQRGVDKEIKLIDRVTPAWIEQPPKGKFAVKVLCAGLNPVDYKLPESAVESRVVRMKKPASPGLDFCGRLVAQPDRIVFGRLAWPVQHGTLSRYVLVSDGDFIDKPKNCTVEEAAGIGIAGLTAFQSIVPYAKAGDRIVIVGASGGVGCFSIQIAKVLQCHVTAVCSGKNAALCRGLGADSVIDYTRGDIVEQLLDFEAFDLVVDNVGRDLTLHRRSQRFLKPTGRFVLVSAVIDSVSGIATLAESTLRPSWLGGPPNAFSLILCQPSKQQLQQIADWIDEGVLRVVVEQVYGFEHAPEAMTRLRQGRACGKIIVRVSA